MAMAESDKNEDIIKNKIPRRIEEVNEEERKSQQTNMKAKRIQETGNHSDGAPKSNVPYI